MNDFTKDELKEIHEILTNVCNRWQEPDSTYDLKDKVQFLIDTYCSNKILDLLEYVSAKAKEKHNTCLTDQFDNGYFWAMKDVQQFLLKGKVDE